MMRSVLTRRWAACLPLLVLLAAAGVIGLCPPEMARAVVREHGPVESLTVVSYLAVAVWLLAARGEGRAFAHTAVLAVALLAARELDLDKAFTSDGILGTSLYLHANASTTEKVIAALVLAACFGVLLRLGRHARAWLADLRRGRAYAYTVATGLCLLPLSKVLDSAPRILRVDAGFVLPPAVKLRVGTVEEVLELAIPLTFLLALFQYREARAARAESATDAGRRRATRPTAAREAAPRRAAPAAPSAGR